MTDVALLRNLLSKLTSEMYNWTETGVRKSLSKLMDKDTVVRMCHPFGDTNGDQYYDNSKKKGILIPPNVSSFC